MERVVKVLVPLANVCCRPSGRVLGEKSSEPRLRSPFRSSNPYVRKLKSEPQNGPQQRAGLEKWLVIT